jgi:AcrR family transcriptional regulator
LAHTARTSESQRGDARREEILAAALEAFSELGFAKATTKRIAQAGALRSPALIYWYFPSKEALLRAVFERYARVLRSQADASAPAPAMAPEEFLPLVARGGLELFRDRQIRQVYRLFMQEWPLLEKLGISLRSDERPDNVYTYMQRYFEDQARRGALRPHDAAAAARSFIAQIWAQVEARHLFPSIYPEPPDDERFVEDLVSLFLDGLRPRD